MSRVRRGQRDGQTRLGHPIALHHRDMQSCRHGLFGFHEPAEGVLERQADLGLPVAGLERTPPTICSAGMPRNTSYGVKKPVTV